jgi:aspartate/methionine/tyrosine aminotransferase
VRFEPVAYMTWAKEQLERKDIHNLGSSGIRSLVPIEEILSIIPEVDLTQTNEDGMPALREAIAARYRVDAAGVLIAEGASLANFLVMAAALRPGDSVLIEEPYYEPLGSVLRALEARIVAVPVDRGEGHAELLERIRDPRGPRWRAVVITNPHNPTGARIPEDLLRELAEACASISAILHVDEAYREILFEDPPGCATHHGPTVVATSSLTKAFGLSHLRIGWAIGPPELVARAKRVHDNLGVVHPYLTEAIGARILGRPGRLDGWREAVRRRVDANRARLGAFLDTQPGFDGSLPAAGILAFPRWLGRPGLPDAETLCERARGDANVALVPGRFFQRPDHLRIAVGGTEESVADAVDALARFLDKR